MAFSIDLIIPTFLYKRNKLKIIIIIKEGEKRNA